MNKKIFVSFPPELFRDLKEQGTNRVNHILDPINAEVNSWNGFVDYMEVTPDHFEFIAKCDNDDIREKMQLLLDASGINNRHGSRETVMAKR